MNGAITNWGVFFYIFFSCFSFYFKQNICHCIAIDAHHPTKPNTKRMSMPCAYLFVGNSEIHAPTLHTVTSKKNGERRYGAKIHK